MLRADYRCTISSVDFRYCWWGSHTTDSLALVAQGLCSNVSGQQVDIPSGSYMQRHSLCWLLQQLTVCVSRSGDSLSTLLQGILRWQLFQGFGCGGSSWKDPVPFLSHSQLVTFFYVKGR